MHKLFLKIAAILGALSVALGAFGAHSLKQLVTDDVVNIFETAVRYQFYHVFALFTAGILYKEFPGKWVKWAGVSFIVGTVLFSGSLYILTWFKGAGVVGYKGVGAITPFGGLFYILGWLFLLVGIIKQNPSVAAKA